MRNWNSRHLVIFSLENLREAHNVVLQLVDAHRGKVDGSQALPNIVEHLGHARSGDGVV